MTQPHAPRFGVVGHPIAHSQSPFIHHAFARQTGFSLIYEKILAPRDGFKTTVQDFFQSGGRGLNITVPFKQEAYDLARPHLSSRATLAAAVNTLWMHDNAVHGCNTDGAGLIADLKRLEYAPKDRRILLLGAGGAARGVIPAVLEAGCRSLHIANRTEPNAQQLMQDFSAYASHHVATLTAGALTQIQGEWDIVINATSSSLDSASSFNIPLNFAASALAYDMVYAAHPTAFMRQALQQGAQHAQDGLGMLVGQAAVSFSIWHGIEPDISPVLVSLRAHMDGDHATA